REDLEELVERAEAAGEDHQRLRQVGEPELAHEEVVELEMQALGDIRVGALLERQPDVQADRLPAAFAGAAVGGLHDPGAAARRDDETVILRLQRLGPRREQPRELARLLVVARPLDRLAAASQLFLVGAVRVLDAPRAQTLERAFGPLAAADARRAEEDDRVLDFLLPESAQRLQVLGQDPDRSRLRALQKLLVQIRERLLRHEGNL